MASFERDGITVDQCQQCRGIFLDRGELERMIEAESNYNQQRAAGPPPGYPPPQAGYPPAQPGYAQPGYAQPGYPPPQPGYGGYGGRRGGHHGGGHGFLGDFFDD